MNMQTSLETTEGVLTNGGDCGMRRARDPQRHLMRAAIITTLITTALLRAGRRQEPSPNSENHGRDMFWGNNWRHGPHYVFGFFFFFLVGFRNLPWLPPPLPSRPCREIGARAPLPWPAERQGLQRPGRKGAGTRPEGKGPLEAAHFGLQQSPDKGGGGEVFPSDSWPQGWGDTYGRTIAALQTARQRRQALASGATCGALVNQLTSLVPFATRCSMPPSTSRFVWWAPH